MIAPNDAAIAPLKPAITRKVTAIAPNNARKHVKHVTIGAENQAWALWTDARNGRSARQQPGRNPICEQSDVFGDLYNAHQANGNFANATKDMDLFLVTPCPLAMQEKGQK